MSTMIDYDAFADELAKILEKKASAVTEALPAVAEAGEKVVKIAPKHLAAVLGGTAVLGAAGYHTGRKAVNDWVTGRNIRLQQQQYGM